MVEQRPSRTLSGAPTETRRKVLAATSELIARRSYRSVTVDAVARASGVSKSTIYRHWASRQDLVLDGFTYRTDELTEVADTGDALADLGTYLSRIAFSLRFAGAASTVVGLIGDAIDDDEFAVRLRGTVIRSRRRGFLVIIVRGQQRGQLRQDVDVATVVDALYGAVHHRLIVTGQPIDDRFVSSLVSLARSALLPSTR